VCPPRRLLQAVYVRCLGLVGEPPLPLDRPGAAVAAFWCGDDWFDSTDAGGVIRTYGAVASSTIVSRALPSWNRSILAEICLCHACAYQATEDGNTPAGTPLRCACAAVPSAERARRACSAAATAAKASGDFRSGQQQRSSLVRRRLRSRAVRGY
jgi:hypothetical protein